ncbi:hypothetical protein DM02DRAFT_146335 [Periconia macrospinosa]|uniref:Uncharacterized protein n=1 Tax=Periconia macrospinosa TaxID=97972 RepID=A0A2V1DC31_9PLEO|nr:hypothetical protein DM02DRAFT_146335 [Periconia macrospinosa]
MQRTSNQYDMSCTGTGMRSEARSFVDCWCRLPCTHGMPCHAVCKNEPARPGRVSTRADMGQSHLMIHGDMPCSNEHGQLLRGEIPGKGKENILATATTLAACTCTRVRSASARYTSTHTHTSNNIHSALYPSACRAKQQPHIFLHFPAKCCRH